MVVHKKSALKIILASGLLAVAGCADVEVEQTAAAAGAAGQRVLVKYKNASGRSAALSGATAVHRDLANHNLVAATMPAAAIEGLSHNPNIELVEEDAKRYPSAEVTPYGIVQTQSDLLSDALTGNRTVCIIDSGYDTTHEDLPQANVAGENDSGTGHWYLDSCGHGTHVAGTIAAVGNNNKGVVGVNPSGNLNLYIVKVFGNDVAGGGECGWAYSSSLIAALDECVANGADVVSMSLGGSLKSRSEDRAFAQAYAGGVLSIAAAGNDGNTRKSYPASYDSVMSVAAIDANKVVASFSQQNDQVEIAAPGVAVRSTVPMGTAGIASVVVGGTTYQASGMSGSADGSGSGALVNCGIGDSVCTAAAGKVCLIQRGTVTFNEKVKNCQSGGGVAAIVYNNAAGIFSGDAGTGITIVAVGVSDTDGAALVGQVGASATVTNALGGNYDSWDGTSMATPHVSGVAALVWSHFPSCTNADIRNALDATAEDLGTAGRDYAYGYGLVQAKDAYDYLNDGACGATHAGGGGGGSVCGDGTCDGGEDAASCPADCGGGGGGGGGGGACFPIGQSCTADAECCTLTCKGKPGSKTCK